MRLDKRKNYYLTLDTETTNSLEDALVYDIGGAIHDKQGNILEKFSFVISDIFFFEKDLMTSAYYYEKLPQYYEKIESKEIEILTFFKARKHILNLMKKYIAFFRLPDGQTVPELIPADNKPDAFAKAKAIAADTSRWSGTVKISRQDIKPLD